MLAWFVADLFSAPVWRRFIVRGMAAAAIAVLAWLARQQTALWLDTMAAGLQGMEREAQK